MPIIVAESLERVSDPLAALLRPRRASPPAAIAGAIVRPLARLSDPGEPPDWLRPGQRGVFGQLLPILRRHHGALLADPVGSGKTWIALAVAQAWQGHSLVLVPAALLLQWERTARRLDVPISLWSHERLSRGNLPPALTGKQRASLVIIDESHHFRNPSSHRYRYLAPLLEGRAVLLLSATPVVNRLADLGAQLHLGARDDALIAQGIRSFTTHLATTRRAATALGELVVTRAQPVEGKPVRLARREKQVDEGEIEIRCRELEQLALSRNPATAALIRTVFWRALASSDAALAASMGRYLALLGHAHDARETGRVLDRKSLRAFVGSDEQQTVLWQMFPEVPQAHDLVLDDLTLLQRLRSEAVARSCGPDEKCRRLEAILTDGPPSLVFTGARETVRYLREQLPNRQIAWCTGDLAGVGHTRMTRDAVLAAFKPGGNGSVLLTTDVSAEGLDLQGAARVIHYDLPWTTVRLDQRDGRALRLGSPHEKVEVIRFDPPPPIRHRLDQLSILARKRRLPRQAGLDQHGARSWSWRDAIARRFGGTASDEPSWCVAIGDRVGILAGFSLYSIAPTGEHDRLASTVGVIGESGSWSEDPELIEEWLLAAERVRRWSEDTEALNRALARLAAMIRERMNVLREARWARSTLAPAERQLVTRLNRLASRAARSRHGARLEAIERALSFVRRGHTAGEEQMLKQLLHSKDAQLVQALSRPLHPAGERDPMTPQLSGLIIFQRGA